MFLYDSNTLYEKETKTNKNSSHSMKLASMNEIQLKVALQNAIDDENYDYAELIKKELERFK